MNTKKCTACRNVKPLTDFYRSSSQKDGLDCYCKVCRREISNFNKPKYVAPPLDLSKYVARHKDADVGKLRVGEARAIISRPTQLGNARAVDTTRMFSDTIDELGIEP